MRFLEQAPRFLFFTGKGGVGKTSLACASALALAESGRKVLLVSTDPASNVGQVLGCTIGPQITAVPEVAQLWALELDPLAAAQAYRERIVGPVRGLLPAAVVQGIEEQLSGACTTEMAAFDEFTALLNDTERTAAYQHIVFDTAPTGHTLRLLQLPAAWSGFLDTSQGSTSCLGPLAGLAQQRQQYQAAVAALADAQRTRLILVARPAPSPLREVARTHAELAEQGLRQQFLVLNGALPLAEAGADALAAALVAREQAALADLPEVLRALPCDSLPLQDFNLLGLPALRQWLNPSLRTASGPAAAMTEPVLTPAPSARLPAWSSLVDGVASSGHGLVLLMGKGGVGKTTLAAALAVALAQRGYPVHLSTTDPAAHLQTTLAGTCPHLSVSRIDPQVETERYRAQVLASRGAALDAAGLALLEEDLRSPCTEEIAVFQAFSRVVAEADQQFVVLDTAPTGHTLLLLDAAGAYHREVQRHMQHQASGAQGAGLTPLQRLQDPAQTKVLVVTLAETTPVLEAAHLQADLRRAGIEPWAWVVNQSLAASGPRSALLRQRAQLEARELAAVAHQHAQRWAVLPMLAQEPVGVARLLALTEIDNAVSPAAM